MPSLQEQFNQIERMAEDEYIKDKGMFSGFNLMWDELHEETRTNYREQAAKVLLGEVNGPQA